MGRVSRDARLAFILMWPHCDDVGRLRASSRALASLLFPFDDDAPEAILGWLAELEDEGCITRYVVGKDHYLQVENFLKHQKIDHPSKSNIPAPLESSRELGDPSRIVALDQGKDRIGMDQGTGSKEGGFSVFFETMPKKINRKAAELAYSKAIFRTTPGILLEAAKSYAVKSRGFEDKYILGAAKWLEDERWTDGRNGHLPISAEQIAETQDKADRLMKRGKYAATYG